MTSTHTKLEERRADIQGLRGLSVLIVVAYHSEILFPSGYLGVDVFFVISGFVIAQSVGRRRHLHEFGIMDFFSRRIRRLGPTFLGVLSTVVVSSGLFITPGNEMKEVMDTAAWSFFSMGNLKLLQLDSYDDLKLNPLRHLWSLGVEEQFYIALALVIYALRTSKSPSEKLRTAIRYGFVVSLVATVTLATSTKLILPLLGLTRFQEFASEWARKLGFFFPAFRAWELLAGVLLGFGFLQIPSIAGKNSLVFRRISLVCILLICSTPVIPEWWSLPAALIIVFNSAVLVAPTQLNSRDDVLENRFLVWCGDLSYPLYLWHWPLLVFAQRLFPDQKIAIIGSLLASFCLAAFSTLVIDYRYLVKQRPLRRLVVPCLGCVALLSGAEILVSSGWVSRQLPTVEPKTDNLAAQFECEASQVGWQDRCTFRSRSDSPLVYLFGDSNARSASDGIFAASDSSSWSLTIGALSACPVNFSLNQTTDLCRRVNGERLNLITTTPPDLLIIVNHWTNYANAPRGTYGDYGSEESQISAFRETLERLDELKIPLLVQEQIPICDYTHNYFKYYILSKLRKSPFTCSDWSQLEPLRERMAFAIQAMIEKYSSGARMIDVRSYICDTICAPFRNGVNMFADSSHISRSASKLLASPYARAGSEIMSLGN